MTNSEGADTVSLCDLNLESVDIDDIAPLGSDGERDYASVRTLSLADNRLLSLPEDIGLLSNLEELTLTNNKLSSLPEGLAKCTKLRVLYLSGNVFTSVPADTLANLRDLRVLYLGGNAITAVPESLGECVGLEVLYLGGNKITELPSSIGNLRHLSVLFLGANRLTALPSSMAQLQDLHTLALHNNEISALPIELVTLRGLTELSLRGNPLVRNFVDDYPNDVPSLFELASRATINKGVPYIDSSIPVELKQHLDSARRCENPNCQGVYFHDTVRHIEFVDFCGKFRVPLMQYLCSPNHMHNATYTAPVSAPQRVEEEAGSAEAATTQTSVVSMERVLMSTWSPSVVPPGVGDW